MSFEINPHYFAEGKRTTKGKDLMAKASGTVWEHLRRLPIERWFDQDNRRLLHDSIWAMEETRATAEETGLNKVCEYLYRRLEKGADAIKAAKESAFIDIDRAKALYPSDDLRAFNIHLLWQEQIELLSENPRYNLTSEERSPLTWVNIGVSLHLYDLIELASKYIQLSGPNSNDSFSINYAVIDVKLDVMASRMRAATIARSLKPYWPFVERYYVDSMKTAAADLELEGETKNKGGRKPNAKHLPFNQMDLAVALMNLFGVDKYTSTELAGHYGLLAGYNPGTKNFKSFRDEIGKAFNKLIIQEDCRHYDQAEQWLISQVLPNGNPFNGKRVTY